MITVYDIVKLFLTLLIWLLSHLLPAQPLFPKIDIHPCDSVNWNNVYNEMLKTQSQLFLSQPCLPRGDIRIPDSTKLDNLEKELQNAHSYLLFGQPCFPTAEKHIIDSVKWTDVNTDLLNVENKFASVTVQTCDCKEMKAVYEITLSGWSEDDFQRVIDDFKCEYSKKNNLFKTGWDYKNWPPGRHKYSQINANVKIFVPKAMKAMNFSGQFGNLSLQNYDGKVKTINQMYGNVKLEKLRQAGYVQVTFGNLDIANTEKIDSIYVQYGNAKVHTIGQIDKVRVSFGNFETTESPKIKHLDLDYSQSVIINGIHDTVILNSNFSSVFLAVPCNMELIRILANYGNLTLTLPDSFCYTISLTSEYGSLTPGCIPVSLLKSQAFTTNALIGKGICDLNKQIYSQFCNIALKQGMLPAIPPVQPKQK